MIKNLLIVGAVVAIVLIGWYLISNFTPRNNAGVQEDEEVTTVATEEVEDGLQVAVTVDYAWQVKDQPALRHHVVVKEGATAFSALRKAVGIENIDFKNVGGNKVVIHSINGVSPSEGRAWLYKIGSFWTDIDVDSYKVEDGDRLKFVISQTR